MKPKSKPKPLDVKLEKELFGSDFLWGVSTAAFQIEGCHDSDGKGLSIWDVFTTRRGKIKGNDHAQTTCDFYNRYKDDIQLVKELNIPNFRFSISWSRILPAGTTTINQNGIDYYNSVIDFLLECGIEPWVTLYHWDLPHALELRGGWANREIIKWFSEYVEICAQNFGDRVKNWMVMNEPSVFTGAGYFLGIHAPGRRGMKNYLQAMHHATLATVAGGKILRKSCPIANIGTTFSCTHIEPYSLKERDIEAAKRVDTLLNRTFLEPILGLGYPESDLKFLRRIRNYMLPEDEKNMSFDFDFIGLQCYTREIVRSSFYIPFIGASLVKAKKRNVDVTEMNWEVYPPSIYHLIKKFNQYKQIKRIIVTENGAAFPDILENGKINDHLRTKYLGDHLRWVLKAKRKDMKVEGYFVWSLTDNFEWAEGYHPRFGLVYVDYKTQKRTIKQSGFWYKDFLDNEIKMNEDSNQLINAEI